jgi:small-conductance mechanosensitive channel
MGTARLITGKRFRWAWVGLALALVLHWFILVPALADQPALEEAPVTPAEINTEPVFLDGEFLFEVPGAADLTAPERASTIERSLAPLINSPDPVEVRIVFRGTESEDGWQQSGTPVIFADDRYIMTITGNDVEVGEGGSPQAQAEILVATIQETLEEVRSVRQGGLYWRALSAAAVAVALALGIHWLAGKIWHDWLRQGLSRIVTWSDEVDGNVTGLRFLFHLSLFLVRFGVWLLAATYIASLFPLTRRLRYLVLNSVEDGLFSRNLQLGSQSYSLFDLLLLLVVLLAMVIAASAVTNLLRSRVLRMTGISVAAQEAIATLSKYTLMLLGGVVILQLWGIDLSSIALIASGLGIGIGLGLQNIVKDFVSGLVMVFERPVQVGDFVDFGQVKGTVARIGSRSTEIRTLDHVSIIVPNSRFLENEVINWSHGNPVSRIRLPVGVSYSSDPEKVREALLEACQEEKQILKAPAPQVFFTGFGDSALEFELVVWISQPSRQVLIRSDLFFAIEASLRRHHIEIPFPQRDLHIRSGSLPIAVSHEAEQLLQQLKNLSDRGTGA